MASLPQKRKFVDLTELDTSLEGETTDSTQPPPSKKFKSDDSPVQLAIIEQSAPIQTMPDLENDPHSNTDARRKDTDTDNNHNQHAFVINEDVQVTMDNNDNTQTQRAKILQCKESDGNVLYYVHYHDRSSIDDEWIPTHKITKHSSPNNHNHSASNPSSAASSNAAQSPLPPSPQPAQSERVLNQKLLDIVPEPARNFSFELDAFQLEAITSLERECVNLLITAHTSAGKTVIAEYAIAKALKNNQRVIYTSPIKALSNQKYREFTEKFGHHNIGLITGDVTKRKNASVLVMTTEILRNMLYHSGSALREVAYVIFDEVHYMKDIERGVVWEESIILLHRKITLIFLSATLSNSDDFAAWITNLKHRQCRIIGTEQRPITLEHYVFAQGSNNVVLVASSAESNGKFIEDNFEFAKQRKLTANEQQITFKQIEQRRKRQQLKISQVQLLLYMLYQNEWCPAIVFAFSKREVEAHAMALNNAINLCTKSESAMIEDVFLNAIDSLSEKDRELPAVRWLLPLLKKGIGVHHGGILPILKEVTEILFQEGLIKVLFATETFSMGVNMPAKCVVFTAMQKFDGRETRNLSAAEYTQMSGRAGRRGIDERGIVVIMMSKHDLNSLSTSDFKSIICGKSAALTSSFRLTYNMLLNICRNLRTNVDQTGNSNDILLTQQATYGDDDDESQGISHQMIIEKSFYRFLMTQRIPEIEGKINDLRAVIDEVENQADFNEMQIYFNLYHSKQRILSKMQRIMCKPYIINKYLEYGRIVFIQAPYQQNKEEEDEEKEKEKEGEEDGVCWGWAVVLGHSKQFQPDTFFVDVLIASSIQTQANNELSVPLPIIDDEINAMKAIDFDKLSEEEKQKYGLSIVRFDSKCIVKVSTARINVASLPSSVERTSDYYQIWRKLLAVQRHFVGEIPVLDALQDMELLVHYQSANKTALVEEFEKRLPKIQQQMQESKYFASKFAGKAEGTFKSQEFAQWNLFKAYKKSKREYKRLSARIRSYNIGQFAEELKCKCRVLKKLRYMNEEQILTAKGTVAAFLESNHGLLITELMFDNFFDKLSAEEVCAVLSVFIDENSKSNKDAPIEGDRNKLKYPLTPMVHEAYGKVLEKARKLLTSKRECGLKEECGLFENVAFRNEEDYILGFRAGLMSAVFHWVHGEDFVDVMALSTTTMFEGGMIRAMKRLRDLLKQLQDAAKAIGNEQLTEKLNECITKMQRGIVFAASLYVDDIEDEEQEQEQQGDEEDEDEETESEDKEAEVDVAGDDD